MSQTWISEYNLLDFVKFKVEGEIKKGMIVAIVISSLSPCQGAIAYMLLYDVEVYEGSELTKYAVESNDIIECIGYMLSNLNIQPTVI